MKINEVKGSLKLFHGGGVDNAVEPDHTTVSPQRISNLQRPTIAARQKRLPPLGDGIAGIGRRKAGTTENSSDQKNSMQRNSGNNNGGDPKSPIQSKKTRSSTIVPGSVSPNLRKTRSSSVKSSSINGTQSVINVSQLRKSISEASRDKNADVSAVEENSIDRSTDMCVNETVQIGKVKSETEIGMKSLEIELSGNASDCDASKRSDGLHTEDFEEEKDDDDDVEVLEEDNEKDELKENNASDEVCEEIDLCPEELIPKDSVRAEPELPDDGDHSDNYEDENNDSDVEEEVVDMEAEDYDDEVDEEIEVEKDLDVKDKEVVNDVKIKPISKVNRINNVNPNSTAPSPTISKLQVPMSGFQTVKLQNCSTKPGPNPTPSM